MRLGVVSHSPIVDRDSYAVSVSADDPQQRLAVGVDDLSYRNLPALVQTERQMPMAVIGTTLR